MGQSRKYTPEQVDKGLIALIALGNSKRASEYLKQQQNIDVPHQTLRDWRNTTHVERYYALAAEHQDKVASIIAAESEEVARYATSLELRVLERIDDKLEDLDAKDAGNTLRNLSVTKGISIDKIASPLRGRPTSVVEHRSLDEIKRRWEARGLIEGTADELPESQLSAGTSAANAPEPSSQ